MANPHLSIDGGDFGLTMAARQTGAARYFTEQMLGGPTRENETNPTIATTSTLLVKANPDRIGLTIQNNGVADVFIGLTNSVSTTNGIRVAAGSGVVTMTVRDDFTLPAREWDAVAVTGTVSMYVLEEIQDIILQAEGA